MRKVVMAIAIRNADLCQCCHRPIRRTDDQIRILRIGISATAHFRCFLTAMRESDQRNAPIIEESVTTPNESASR